MINVIFYCCVLVWGKGEVLFVSNSILENKNEGLLEAFSIEWLVGDASLSDEEFNFEQFQSGIRCSSFVVNEVFYIFHSFLIRANLL